MEYWSIGSRTHHSTTPSLHYSSPDETIERNEACEGFFSGLLKRVQRPRIIVEDLVDHATGQLAVIAQLA